MKNPKISIVIPIYNVEDYLRKCLLSVTRQNLRDIEILCVDDGTQDQSCSIVEEFRSEDDRVHLIHQENKGLAGARNTGLLHAGGEYVWFVDSDDFVEENACERLYREILERKPDIITFGANVFPVFPEVDPWVENNLSPRTELFISGKERPEAVADHGYRKSAMALFKRDNICPYVWRSCFRRKFLLHYHLLFQENVRFGEDTIFYFSTYPYARQIVVLSDKLYDYRHYRRGSLMYINNQDMFGKYQQHIHIADAVLETWEERGWLKEYGSSLADWIIKFVGYPIWTYEGYGKKDLLRSTAALLRKYGLAKYSLKARVAQRILAAAIS